MLTAKPTGLKSGRFVLSEAGRAVGGVTNAPFVRSARATFPADLSEPAQVFLVWIARMMWRRDRNGLGLCGSPCRPVILSRAKDLNAVVNGHRERWR